jgi:hypothetical protein
MKPMGHSKSIATLRSEVSALVEQEAALLTRAFELSRTKEDPAAVDALFARVQAIQVERTRLKHEIGNVLGVHRMHVAAEVWKPGTYEYRQEAGGAPVYVRVTQGPLGLQVQLPDRRKAVGIETLEGTFDGPLSMDGPPPEGPAS